MLLASLSEGLRNKRSFSWQIFLLHNLIVVSLLLGSQKERSVYEEAVRRGEMTKWCGVLLASQIPQMPQKPPKVTLEITDTGLAINGKDLELCLSLSSKHSAPRELSVHLIGQAMRYTGVPDCQVWSAVENVRLQPRQGGSLLTSYKSYENCIFYTLGLNKHTYDSAQMPSNAPKSPNPLLSIV